MFDFLDFSLINLLDIMLVALLLYYAYRLVRGTAAINIFVGIVILYLIWKITDALKMELLSSILGGFMSVGVFALIVVFQQEIRKLLLMLGSSNLANRKVLNRYFRIFNAKHQKDSELDIEVLMAGCAALKKQKIGALLVLERNNSLAFLKPTGVIIQMELSVPVLESIFHKNAPLHDGAILIENNSVTAARVVLPISEKISLPKRYGLRHKAAVGITEKTDALVLVISEETGIVSYFKNGESVPFHSLQELESMISKDMN